MKRLILVVALALTSVAAADQYQARRFATAAASNMSGVMLPECPIHPNLQSDAACFEATVGTEAEVRALVDEALRPLEDEPSAWYREDDGTVGRVIGFTHYGQKGAATVRITRRGDGVWVVTVMDLAD